MEKVVIAGEPFNVCLEGEERRETIVLAHQLGGSLAVWDDLMPALRDRFRVLRFDSRGHGASVGPHVPGSLNEYARDALAVMKATGVERAHWIGLSMGAMIGQAVMALEPDRIGRAVLASTAAQYGSPDIWNGRIAAVRAKGTAGLAAPTQERWFTPKFCAAQPDAVARVMAAFRATSTEGYAAACAALRDADQRDLLPSIRSRVLVIVGAHDCSAPPELGAAVAGLIAGARLVALDASHLSPVEDAAGFAEAALEFLTAPEVPASPALARQSGAKRPPRNNGGEEDSRQKV